MNTRRSFLISSGITAAASRAAVGANEQIRMGLIGAGNRGTYMQGVLGANPDCVFVAACDVYKPNRDAAAAKMPGKVETYVDYRKVLERKDIDAVLIASPDHWHGQMLIDACDAGKDVYCEKPFTNDIAMGWKMLDAVARTKRIVQVGLQQRYWKQFVEGADMVKSGMFGQIYHAGLQWEGYYTRPPEQPTDPPEDLDWNLFQGPAEHRPYTRGRQRMWRAYYDYAGGLLTDQGVHIVDVVHWYMNAKAPLTCSASAQYVAVKCPDKDQLPDSIMVSWQYDNFVMSFTNAYMPHPEYMPQGNFFYGTGGALHVNRAGYTIKPINRRGPKGETISASFEQANVGLRYDGRPAEKLHTRNFLDCVKSRQKPTADAETGFYSTLPTLIGVLACRTGRTYAWDGKQARPV